MDEHNQTRNEGSVQMKCGRKRLVRLKVLHKNLFCGNEEYHDKFQSEKLISVSKQNTTETYDVGHESKVQYISGLSIIQRQALDFMLLLL
jgi:hypothetical protein